MKHHEEGAGWTNEMVTAITEIQSLISDAFPGTLYETSYQDDPAGMHMIAKIDTEDIDAVVDCFIDRLLTMQVDENLPLYVIPVRSAKQAVKQTQSPHLPFSAQ